MRNRKGYSLIELLAVLVLISLVALLVSVTMLKEIDRARGSTLTAEARMVYIAAETVMIEAKAAGTEISDDDYMEGLPGTAGETSFPVHKRLSDKMNALLAPDVVLSEKPDTGAAKVDFTVKDGIITKISYRTVLNNRLYTIIIADGETSVEYEKLK